jgi:beta-aspartyl-peptidase (threonine type)
VPSLVVHGGAGQFETGRHTAAIEGVRRACEAGWAMLSHGAAAMDVVEQVVTLLEDDPVFDAGTGSYPNTEGFVEMDAIVVDGATLNFGAVAAIRHVKNPIQVARRVMTATPHCLLVGDGATRFAHAQGFAAVTDAQLLGGAISGPAQGTVGAVALDGAGHIATATSTGGIKDTRPGRVGDSPIIGCGAIAEDGIGGASATGKGEGIMKVMMTRRVLEYLQGGLTAQAAADAALNDLADRVNGTGGIICLDAQGRIGIAYNTPHMARAWASQGCTLQAGL